MNVDVLFKTALETSNEILTSAIVVIAASLLLYNLTQNLHNRVTRSASAVLTCVTFAYLCDVFISLSPSMVFYEMALRVQWLGIAFIPAALFHLSDALLATTGLPSRGRRRRIVRILYLIAGAFFLMATLTDELIHPVINSGRISTRSGNFFGLYFVFFVVLCVIVFINVERARRRCLTQSTRRRMGYLQAAILTPAFGIFPYSFALPPGAEFSLLGVLLINIGNVIVITMLIFLSYPLSFFGSDKPDRTVKVELLRFLVRGPATGLLALATIIGTIDATRILSLQGEDFTPFAVVAVVLLWQWTIALLLPWLEQKLVYGNTNGEHIKQLQNLSDHVLTHTDILQLLEATLEACCDFLRTHTAFVISFQEQEPELVKAIGTPPFTENTLLHDAQVIQNSMASLAGSNGHLAFQNWQHYQLTPLYSRRNSQDARLIGVLGIETTPNHLPTDGEDYRTLQQFVWRAARTLDDMALQAEIFAALEGLLPQISAIRRDDKIEYVPPSSTKLPLTPFDHDEIYEQVHAALRHYWGGTGMTRSRLQDLQVVRQMMKPDETPVQALRSVLQQVVEKQRPRGEPSLDAPEWTLYNILNMRFIEGKTVKVVAYRLKMSEADFYRKQRVALAAVTDTLLEMEANALKNP
jgi:hypothetical protein